FVPDTLAEDGDPLDAMVLLGEPTFPGCEIQARIVAMLDMSDDKGPDQKLLFAPCPIPTGTTSTGSTRSPRTCCGRSSTSSPSTSSSRTRRSTTTAGGAPSGDTVSPPR